MINLPFNTSIAFGKPDPKYGYKILIAIFRPGFIATLDKWGLVEIRKGYNLQLSRRFRICNFKLAR
jgi:hypothetical protein